MLFHSAVSIDDHFMAPADTVLRDYVRAAQLRGHNFTDARFLRAGVARVIEGHESGRAFLQALADPGAAGEPIARTTWFDALHSRRRLKFLEELCGEAYRRFERQLGTRDHLRDFPELKDHPVWAVDGHQIEHSCHSPRSAKGVHVASGLIYGLCLHAGLMRPLARFQGDGARGHEWPAFKKHWAQWLKAEPRPLLPIIVGDPAYVDNQYWVLAKRQRQALIITREKENMAGTVYGAVPFDRDDPINAGVLAYEYVGYSNAALYRVRYQDPKTGKPLVFITTATHLRPGVVALLYFLRWKIEKAYDVFKNKLHVRKAWAVGPTAALGQAHFVILTHNLLTLLLARLEADGLSEDKVVRRTAQREAAQPSALAQQMVQHFTILTAQFIRLVRHCLRTDVSYNQALPFFRQRLSSYL